MGTKNGHDAPFLECASLRKRKRKRIKQIYKISKKGNKKRSCHLVPKVVIDLPFEGRKVEGSWKYIRERVPKAGSRWEFSKKILLFSLQHSNKTTKYKGKDITDLQRM